MNLFEKAYARIIDTLDKGKPLLYKDNKLEVLFYKRENMYIAQSNRGDEMRFLREDLDKVLKELWPYNFSLAEYSDNVIVVNFVTRRREE